MEHEYEKTQNFYAITKFLHSTRYRNLEILARQVANKNKKIKIVDIGCGTAKAYDVIRSLNFNFYYIGIEIREDFTAIANERYNKFDNFKIICDSVENVTHTFTDADLIIGLESFEHIPESIVVRIIEAIAKSNFNCLYITVPNEIGPSIFLKNVGSFLMGYNRYKEYNWTETLAASIYNLDKVEGHGTGHKGFDYRWLAHTLRQNCKIIKVLVSPLPFIPRFISPSIGFICRNDNR